MLVNIIYQICIPLPLHPLSKGQVLAMQPILAQLNPKLSIDIHLSIPIKSIPIKSIRYNSSRYGHGTCTECLKKNVV